ncbi:MAG: hypothetical protein J6T64_03050 [Bacteroidaceae bacterium]|nr:hypothetical protein [Bacteroidaceae bacterium]
MKKRTTLSDYIAASRKGSREVEQELLGPGFHAQTRIHCSKKLYSRRAKHKKDYIGE